MRWRERISDVDLANGMLTITGDLSGSAASRKLTNANFTEIVAAVRNGAADYQGVVHPVHTLTFIQVDFSARGREFQTFVHDLLQLPNLTELNFSSKSSTHHLNAREVRAITQEVQQSQHLTSLSMAIVWHRDDLYRQVAGDLAAMLQANRSLTEFWCDFDDSCYDYSVLRAALGAQNQLTRISLSATAMPLMIRDDLTQLIFSRPTVTVRFEGGRTLVDQQRENAERIARLMQVQQQAAAMQRDQRMRHQLRLMPPPPAAPNPVPPNPAPAQRRDRDAADMRAVDDDVARPAKIARK